MPASPPPSVSISLSHISSWSFLATATNVDCRVSTLLVYSFSLFSLCCFSASSISLFSHLDLLCLSAAVSPNSNCRCVCGDFYPHILSSLYGNHLINQVNSNYNMTFIVLNLPYSKGSLSLRCTVIYED